jgi:prevent-host-death family protein
MKGMVTNVRNAKARLSELIERAADGEEVVITSNGKPRARLLAVASAAKPYRVNRRLLGGGVRRGRPAEQLVRDDRDGRD